VLPNLVVIGAMKCGTTALHRYLGAHPDIAMSNPKELNFFLGSNWHRGVGWYAGNFPDALVCGESSPGYTSPDHPETAERMAAVIPDAKIILLVRDPVERAVSQYRHHWADGDETRPLREAVFDHASQYVTRGRYYERLGPFLQHFAARQLAVVSSEELVANPYGALGRLFRLVGVDDGPTSEIVGPRANAPPPRLPASAETAAVRSDLRVLFRDDAERLRELTGQDFPYWSV